MSDRRHRLRRLVRHHRRAVAAGLAMTAAALVAAAGPGDTGRARAQTPHPQHRQDTPRPAHPAPELVTAPVRIADAATVRLLRPGDRVDVIAAGAPGAVDSRGGPQGAGGTAGAPQPQVVAAGVRVVEVPREESDPVEGDPAGMGALLLLSVPRQTAARLAGAGATARLAVTLC